MHCRQDLRRVSSPQRLGILTRLLDRFDAHAVPRLSTLRKSVIHGDWNEYNVLVDEDVRARDREVVGAIDFGDLVHSYTIGDLAIALAYAMLAKANPLAAAVDIVRAACRIEAFDPKAEAIRFIAVDDADRQQPALETAASVEQELIAIAAHAMTPLPA